MKNNAQLNKQLQLLKDRLEQVEKSNQKVIPSEDNPSVNTIPETESQPIQDVQGPSNQDVKQATRSYLTLVKSFFYSLFTPIYNLLFKYNLLAILGYLKIALKFYGYFYLIFGSILMVTLNFDLIDTSMFLVNSYDSVISYIKSKLSSVVDSIFSFFKKVVSKSQPIDQFDQWPDLEEHLKRRREIQSDLQKSRDILEKHSKLYYPYGTNPLLDDFITKEESHWYDFMKSRWFYIPAATITVVGVGFLAWYNLDSITSFFKKPDPKSPPSGDINIRDQITPFIRINFFSYGLLSILSLYIPYPFNGYINFLANQGDNIQLIRGEDENSAIEIVHRNIPRTESSDSMATITPNSRDVAIQTSASLLNSRVKNKSGYSIK